MPYLGDLVGQLLAEIAIARAHVDLETIRVAELYAGDEFLKHFPVPRFRVPSITIDLPVAVRDVGQPARPEAPRGEANIAGFRDAFPRLLRETSERFEVRLNETELNSIYRAADSLLRTQELSGDVTVSATPIAERLVRRVVQTLRNPTRPGGAIDEAKVRDFQADLSPTIRHELLSLRTQPPRLDVLATAVDIAPAAEKGLLLHLHLTVAEEAVEWTVGSEDDETQSRLLPE